jgi:hypothetical protein
MRIVFLSDFHLDLPQSPIQYREKYLLDQIYGLKPDYLILGGDTLDFHRAWDLFLDNWTMQLPGIKICVLLGNHDLWSYNGQEVFEREDVYKHVWDVCKKYDVVFLEEEPIVHDDILLCGSIGWYDYSVKPEHTNVEYLIVNKGRVNNDGNYIHSKIGDLDYAASRNVKLKKNMSKRHKGVKNIYVFTHVPVLKQCVVPCPNGQRQHEWDMSNCYFFNTSMGDMICQNKKVRLIVSGHIHRYIRGVLPNGIEYVTSGSDYYRPELIVIDTVDDQINIHKQLTQ